MDVHDIGYYEVKSKVSFIVASKIIDDGIVWIPNEKLENGDDDSCKTLNSNQTLLLKRLNKGGRYHDSFYDMFLGFFKSDRNMNDLALQTLNTLKNNFIEVFNSLVPFLGLSDASFIDIDIVDGVTKKSILCQFNSNVLDVDTEPSRNMENLRMKRKLSEEKLDPPSKMFKADEQISILEQSSQVSCSNFEGKVDGTTLGLPTSAELSLDVNATSSLIPWFDNNRKVFQVKPRHLQKLKGFKHYFKIKSDGACAVTAVSKFLYKG